MKNKKFLILLAVAIAFISVVVAFAVVFSVGEARSYYRTFDGSECAPTQTAPSVNDILKLCKGQNVFLLDKDLLLSELNKSHRDWYAFRVVVEFPNVVQVYFIQNRAVAKVRANGAELYVDSFGYIMQKPEGDGSYLDITSAFSSDPVSAEEGSPLKYASEQENARLKVILGALMAVWQCNVEFDNVGAIFGTENLFTFDTEENLIVTMPSGAKILVKSPETTLADRIINGLSVYYSKNDLQKTGVVITVLKNGTITTAE